MCHKRGAVDRILLEYSFFSCVALWTVQYSQRTGSSLIESSSFSDIRLPFALTLKTYYIHFSETSAEFQREYMALYPKRNCSSIYLELQNPCRDSEQLFLVSFHTECFIGGKRGDLMALIYIGLQNRD